MRAYTIIENLPLLQSPGALLLIEIATSFPRIFIIIIMITCDVLLWMVSLFHIHIYLSNNSPRFEKMHNMTSLGKTRHD
jgi:hypothetical protein